MMHIRNLVGPQVQKARYRPGLSQDEFATSCKWLVGT